MNDNGGTLSASNFTINATGTNVSQTSFIGSELGVDITVHAGAYSVDEIAATGYAKTLSADCSGTVASGEIKTCIITNNDIQPKLTVTKVVVNDNGGTKVVSDFPLSVGNTLVTSGEQNGFNVGSYTVSEILEPNYTVVFSGDCSEGGVVALGLGETKSCTLTNNDKSVSQPTDVCPNIEGAQATVPAGMILNSSGNCVTPEVTSSGGGGGGGGGGGQMSGVTMGNGGSQVAVASVSTPTSAPVGEVLGAETIELPNTGRAGKNIDDTSLTIFLGMIGLAISLIGLALMHGLINAERPEEIN